MLTPASNAILDRLCSVTGQSKSGLIAEFLEDTAMPMFERMVIVLEAATTATDEAKAAARQGFQDAEDRLFGIAGLTSDLFDIASRPILDDAERITRRASSSRVGRSARAAGDAAGPAPAALPPHVTRGSGTPNAATEMSNSPMKPGSDVEDTQNISENSSKRPSKALKPKSRG